MSQKIYQASFNGRFEDYVIVFINRHSSVVISEKSSGTVVKIYFISPRTHVRPGRDSATIGAEQFIRHFKNLR